MAYPDEDEAMLDERGNALGLGLDKRPGGNKEGGGEDEEGAGGGSGAKRQTMGEGDDLEDKVTMKFLISNAAAGSVIGKAGATINEFQAQSGARIQLSRSKEFFPGTQDRIILLTGSVNAILTALHLVLSKLLQEEAATGVATGMLAMGATQVKLVVPNAACGGVIGKGGATIRSYVEDSNANIKLSAQNQQLPGVNERIVTVTGSLEQVLRAVALIITKLTEDPAYVSQVSSRPMSYPTQPPSGYAALTAAAANLQAGLAPALMSTLGGAPSAVPTLVPAVPGGAAVPMIPGALGSPVGGAPPAPASVMVAVPDEHIGAVVGRGGRTITEIQQLSGVRIKISDRNDYVPGTRNRKVTLTGTPEAVQIAQFLISQKVQANAAEMAASGGVAQA